MKPVAGLLDHDDVVCRDTWEGVLIEFYVVQDLPLERVCPVQHQTGSLKAVVEA